MSTLKPPVWKKGVWVMVTSLWHRSQPTWVLMAFQVIVPWVKTAPLGLPVVPEV
ncbi:hypothetical protein D3C78_1728240 [compost metagenome]